MRNIILAAAALVGLTACTTAETSTPAFDATQRAAALAPSAELAWSDRYLGRPVLRAAGTFDDGVAVGCAPSAGGVTDGCSGKGWPSGPSDGRVASPARSNVHM